MHFSLFWKILRLRAVVLNGGNSGGGGNFTLREHLAMSRTFSVVTAGGGKVQLASMLLTILKYTRNPTTGKNAVAQNGSSAKVGKPGFKACALRERGGTRD